MNVCCVVIVFQYKNPRIHEALFFLIAKTLNVVLIDKVISIKNSLK